MYIPYEIIGNFIYKFLKNEKIKSFLYDKKIAQNIEYIKHNKPKVLQKLRKKLENGKKLNVVFYVYDETKWKCQSLYELLEKDKRFNVKILVTKTSCEDTNNSSYINDKDIERTYNFFKTTNNRINVELAYDTKKHKFIPLKKFNPDIIFYQHPWYVKTEQGPVVCSKFALTCYIPYYYPIEISNIDYYLRFHSYVERYYVLDNYIKEQFEKLAPELRDKLKAVGYPYLDYFALNQEPTENKYIIYAPHWTISDNGVAFGTFKWNGQFILNYAKTHPEIKWVFKPHPLLRKSLETSGIMAEEEIQQYYSEWENIGIKHESGNYLELFKASKMMITDCGSFLGEYFATGNPIIHLMSEKSVFNTSENPILKTYYRAKNLDELKELLDELPSNDTMRELRLQTIEQIGLKNNCASKNIINDIITTINTCH